MRFNYGWLSSIWHNYPLRIAIMAFVWLILITGAHYRLNGDHETRQVIHMGYMPVITNLAAPLLDYVSIPDENRVRYKALKFASFAEMAEALRNDEIQAAFIIAPLSIVLRQQGEDVKIVYIGNRHESTLVIRKDLQAHSLEELSGRTIAVPMRYSGHNLLLKKLLKDSKLDQNINVVEMNPPDMASALAAGSLDAYFVGEPFAAQTLKFGSSNLLFRVEQVDPDFICNLLVVKGHLAEEKNDVVRDLVQGAIRSGLWAQNNIDEAAEIASRYWGQPVELVKYALETPENRIVFDRYIPMKSELQAMADLMVEFNLLKKNSIDGLIEDRFAKEADITHIERIEDILLKQ